jgi:hypothetical protein
MKPEGILVLKPHPPLEEKDFDGLNAAVNAYLEVHRKLHGVLIHSKYFPGWEDFGAFVAHMRFVGEHHNEVEFVALATDSLVAGILETLGNHFSSAEVRHFPLEDDGVALEWLETSGIVAQ